jgi:hypothetical protein
VRADNHPGKQESQYHRQPNAFKDKGDHGGSNQYDKKFREKWILGHGLAAQLLTQGNMYHTHAATASATLSR